MINKKISMKVKNQIRGDRMINKKISMDMKKLNEGRQDDKQEDIYGYEKFNEVFCEKQHFIDRGQHLNIYIFPEQQVIQNNDKIIKLFHYPCVNL